MTLTNEKKIEIAPPTGGRYALYRKAVEVKNLKFPFTWLQNKMKIPCSDSICLKKWNSKIQEEVTDEEENEVYDWKA